MSEYLHLVTPVGRLVRGSLTERTKTDYDGNLYADGEGPFELGFAIRKDDPSVGEFLGQLYTKAVTDAPNLKAKADMEWQSGFSAGTFRFKVRDGDKPNQKGQTNQNTIGSWVLNLSTTLPSKFTYTDQYGLKLTDPMGQPIAPRSEIPASMIKIGDYAHIAVSVKYNGKIDHTAGIYLSQGAVMLAGYGEAISGGLSLDEAFATLPGSGALPAGASVTALPGASTSVQTTAAVPAATMPGNGAIAAPGGAPAGMQQSQTASPSMGSAPAAPHTGFVQNAVGGTVGMPGLPGQ